MVWAKSLDWRITGRAGKLAAAQIISSHHLRPMRITPRACPAITDVVEAGSNSIGASMKTKTVKELRAEAKALKIPKYSKMRKAELLEAIAAHHEYDPADNSAKCYELAIRTMREKLESFRREQIGDCTIYELRDPRSGEVRYVGKTVNPLNRRLTAHIVSARKHSRRRVCRWIRSLLDKGMSPMIHALEIVPAGHDWASREAHFIEFYRSRGADLTNLTDGGEGLPGLIFSEDHRRKIGISLRTGEWFECETCDARFWRKRNEIEKGNNRFCSRECYSRAQKGVTKPVPRLCTDRGVEAAAAEKLSRTHCKRGHPLSGDNLFTTSGGGRGCKECRKIHKRDYRARAAHVEA